MEFIDEKYKTLCEKKSDINEHLPTLYKYASQCESVIECGVRYCVSSWALIYGLLNNNKLNKKSSNFGAVASVAPDLAASATPGSRSPALVSRIRNGVFV